MKNWTSTDKILVRINKQLQTEKREKIGNFFIPSHLMDFTNNLQFGEIVALGTLASKQFPMAKIGDIAIFDHVVEFKVEGDTSLIEKEMLNTDEHLVDIEPNGDEIRLVKVSNDLGTQLFGIYKDNEFIPAPNMVLCYKEFSQSGFQLVKGIYVNTELDKKPYVEALEVANHAKKEMLRVIQQMPRNEKTYKLLEDANSRLKEAELHIKRLNKILQKPVLLDLTIASVSETDSAELKKGDIVTINKNLVYPLDLFGKNFILVKKSDFLLCKLNHQNKMLTPLKNNVIIKLDKAKTETEKGIFIPGTAEVKITKGTVKYIGSKVEEVKVGDIVEINPNATVEIFENDESLLVIREDNIYCIVE